MKKDDWVKIFVTSIIGWLTVVGGGGWYFMVFDKLFLAYWLGVPIILFVIMLICIKWFSEPEKDKVIETLKEFISFLISNLEGKIEEVDRYLSGDKRLALTLIRPNYENAHSDVLGDYGWVKEKVDEYNDLVRDEKLEKARETAIELKNSLEKLKSKLLKKYSILVKDVERTAHTPYVIREKKRTKEDDK